MKILKRIINGIIIFIFCIIIILGIMNGVKFIIYKDYYAIEKTVCVNPGLNDGAIPQGIAVASDKDLLFTSAYMENGASRIYITNSKSESKYVELYKSEAEAFTGHVGGIAYSNGKLYLADGGYIYIINESSLDNNKVILDERIKVNNSASFVSITGDYLYVGEFNNGKQYKTEHRIEVENDTYYAICSVYSLADLSKPIKIYSIRDKVQGFCITDKGTIVLSTSYGMADSMYYIYNKEDIKEIAETYEGVPLIKLDSYSSVIKGPAMSEDLEYANGRVYCLTESASNKYIFGKLFFGNKIYSLGVD